MTDVEGTINSHYNSHITIYRDDGKIMTVELVPGVPFNAYSRIDVRTNGQKVGEITEPEHEIHLFRDDQT